MLRLNTTTVLRLPHLEHRHAGDRALRIFERAGVHDVVRADHEHDVGVREVVVDLVHLEHDVVRHVRFGEQHVHVSGQAAGDRVDAEAHVDAFAAQPLRDVADRVLRARHRHAVARHDDHFLRGAQRVRDFFGAWSPRRRLAAPPPADSPDVPKPPMITETKCGSSRGT